MTDNWYTITEAAGLLGVSSETIRRLINTGELESKKDGRKRLVRILDASIVVPQMPHTSPTDVTVTRQLLLEERTQMLQEQIDNLKEHIRDLETDKGFLLSQIGEKDKVINELMPRALPKPRTRIGERIKRLFRRPLLDTQ
jgi:excisionase family DNA binding protein